MEIIILDVILVIFPILMYLFFSCYNILSNKNIERIIFIITMVTSLYFSLSCVRYFSYMNILLIFCNIPIIICYFKREAELGILLSLCVILISYLKYDVNIYIISLKYLSYFLVYILFFNKRDFNYLFLKLLAIIQGFFLSFEYFMITGANFNRVYFIILDVIFIYVITFFCLYLFKLANNITVMHEVVEKNERDTKLKDSLFKLTHEIKNPIAVCKGYLAMINLDNRDKSEKYLEIIKSEIDRSLNVMSDFMEYSKIKISKDIFDIGLLLDDIYDSFNTLLIGNKIKFIYNNSYDELYLLGDYDRLKQVFVNIIKNSIESIIDSGVISINILKGEHDIKIIIQDNGVGMTREELENIKQMFYTTKKDGTGLGVALSNEIIMAHDGTLEYSSVKNEGTKCIVSLPL